MIVKVFGQSMTTRWGENHSLCFFHFYHYVILALISHSKNYFREAEGALPSHDSSVTFRNRALLSVLPFFDGSTQKLTFSVQTRCWYQPFLQYRLIPNDLPNVFSVHHNVILALISHSMNYF